MTRSSFFAALWLGLVSAFSGKSQQCVGPLWSSTCKKLNGQCPVCGWEAPRGFGKSLLLYVNGAAESALLRCEKCNSAFWSDV